jgi:hypothetical protein
MTAVASIYIVPRGSVLSAVALYRFLVPGKALLARDFMIVEAFNQQDRTLRRYLNQELLDAL